MKTPVFTFLAGVLFALGLVLGGMTQPAKVIGFLDFFGTWDPSLMFVMGGAVAVHFVLFRLITRRASPLFDEKFHLPTKRDIDVPLVLGAVLFGIGWGLAGYCPGPAIASVATGYRVAMFMLAMIGGMVLYRLFGAKLTSYLEKGDRR